MEDRIVEFANMLRRRGIRVSLSENMDALRVLDLLGVEDSAVFRNSLRATLVKRAGDIVVFDELFDIYFLGLGASTKESERAMMDFLGLSPREFQALIEDVEALLRRWDQDVSTLARSLLSGDMGRVERLIREAAEDELVQTPNIISMISFSRLAGRLDFDRLERDFAAFRIVVAGSGQKPETSQLITLYLDRRLQDIGRLIQIAIDQEYQKRSSRGGERRRSEYVDEKSFAYYTEDDVQTMNQAVTRLARRFKNLLSLRRKKARRGRFSVKSTLRKNLQYGGVPFRIHLDRRKKEKPQITILCDISDSVLNASRFMLQFVYSVQDLYSKVRSFVFVSDIGEVTRLFEENKIQQAVDRALKGEVVDVYTHSNFGRAFELFHKEYLSAVTGKTTVLIIGDGRNNYNRANEWVLKEVRCKAKRLIWLNPESRLTWGIGDSEMPRYMPHCNLVEECRNIRQLYHVIDRITT